MATPRTSRCLLCGVSVVDVSVDEHGRLVGWVRVDGDRELHVHTADDPEVHVHTAEDVLTWNATDLRFTDFAHRAFGDTL